MQTSITVVTPATSTSLVNIDEARLALNLSKSTDMTAHDQVELFIQWASGEISTLANRVFAREEVVETFRNIDGSTVRLYLERWPVAEIASVDENGVLLVNGTDYEIDAGSGTLARLGDTAWTEPVIVTYTGGYQLPNDAPPALKQATLLLTREAYQAATRGDSTVRMISHKESRVIYFDPNARGGGQAGGQVGSVGSATKRAVIDLLRHFMRFPV